MNKKQTKRQRDIKTKLMAAICMLLVSSIMMVSTTYAWFTLSTAPEVTGITTAVGANGNLEMALQPLDGDSSKITSATGDSMATQAYNLSNTTWGNLVNVATYYGLENISLYPAALETVDSGTTEAPIISIKQAPLATPEYGADGRIAELKGNTTTGIYRDGGFYTTALDETGNAYTPYGVRAIGTSSGMTARNLAYRQALSDASVAASQAKSAASTSLNNNGSVLADVAITHALNEGTEQYTQAQVDAMTAIVNDLLGTTGKTGALQYIENALKQYILAASIAPAATETTFDTLKTNIENATLAQLKAGTVEGAVVSDTMKNTWIAELEEAKASAQEARDNIPTTMSGGTYYTWDDVKNAMAPLIDVDYLKLNDTPVSDVMDDPGSAAGSIMKNGLNLTMLSGSGVYADIADFAGNYSAGIIIPELAYGTMVVPNVEATMNTSGINPTYLANAATAVPTFFAVGGGDGSTPLTDFYGYIIDLAFRTNAADSWLQIQPTAVDRIYGEDGSNTNTQGHGATMSYKSTSSTFSTAKVTELMKAVRIVFFNTNDQVIVGYARLDSGNPNTATDGTVTMPLYMCDKDGVAKTDVADTDRDESVGIMELTQNTIHELSVLVYLDGNAVQNDDVAADAAESMTGSMSLQFSSSANLVAMDYSDLMSGNGGALNGTSASEPTTPTTPTVTDVIEPTVTIDEAVTDLTEDAVSDVALSDTGFGFTVTGYDAAKHVVAVTINGGTSVTANYVDGTGFVCATDADVESVAISITAVTQTPEG